MSEWSVRLGGASGLVIDKTTKQGREVSFVPSYERVVNEKGETEGYRFSAEIEGNVISTTASDVADKFIDLAEEITDQGARQFEALLDSAAKWDIKPADCFWGPWVSSVRAVDDEGNGDGHWRYAFTVSAFIKKLSGYDVDTWLRIEKTAQGEVVRKTWHAFAKAKTSGAAKTAVLAFKPGGQAVTEMLEERFKRTQAEAEWVWSAEKPQTAQSWSCRITVQSGADYIVDKQAEGAAVLHLVRNDVTVVEVMGEIVSTDPATVAPAGHFSPSDKIKRAYRQERGDLEAQILRKEDGTYIFHYHEVWLIDGPAPAPNHEDGHNLIGAETSPGDGAIAG